jgi:uncharacterized protein (TIGR02145 family)
MKLFFLLILSLCSTGYSHAQSIGIGTTNPQPSARLDISSTNAGFLPPRLTYAQRNAIPNPVAGLLIWCTDCNEMQVFDGTMWKNMNGQAALGPSLKYIRLCNSVWTLKNLDVSTYRNGDFIPVVTDPIQWSTLTTGARCWYLNDSSIYGATYGQLYNWYALNDPRGLAPAGWHIPSKEEWMEASECFGGDSISSLKLRDTSQLWNYSLPFPVYANNASGFTGLPGGFRVGTGGFLVGQDGVFSSLGTDGGFWWTSTADGSANAWFYYLVYDGPMILNGAFSKTYGFAIRCVKD